MHRTGDEAALAAVVELELAQRIREQLRAPGQLPCLRAVERIVHAAGRLALFPGVEAAATAYLGFAGAAGLEAQPGRHQPATGTLTNTSMHCAHSSRSSPWT